MKKILIWVLLLFLLVSIASANDLVFKKDNLVDLKINCFDVENDVCSGACSISILYPNGSSYINSERMSINGLFFNYTLPSSSLNGEYKSVVNCSDTFSSGYTNFNFFINEQGNNPTQSQSIIYFVVLGIIASILILNVMGIFWVKSEYIKIFLFGTSYLFFVWLFAIIQDISSAYLYYSFLNSFSSIVFKILVIGIFPILFYTLAMITYKIITDKQIKALAKRGIRK